MHPSGTTAVVVFSDYGNCEEVLLQNIKPVAADVLVRSTTGALKYSATVTVICNRVAGQLIEHEALYPNCKRIRAVRWQEEDDSYDDSSLEFRRGGDGQPRRSRPTQQYYQPPRARD